MDDVSSDSSEPRQKTDASLTAERASARSFDDDPADAAVIRVQDDLIERGRILADERLLKFRSRADDLLANERLAVPTRDIATARERRRSDDMMRAERGITDALLDEARDRADARIDETRARNATVKAHQRALSRDTDVSLKAERDQVASDRGRRQDQLAMVTHDLRSPLAIITLSAHFLFEESTDATTRAVIQDIDRAAARMERLILDLLDVARIEAGNLHIVTSDHDIGAFLDEMSNSYRTLFEDRGLVFDVQVPSIPVVATFDHDRLVQVVSNLLGNALKFTPRKGTVSLLVHAGVDEIEFEVRDDGAGIPADAQAHLFERFWQLEGAGRGLGLGLYICPEIVERHDGRIWVESTSGLGTTVHFTLPTASPLPLPMSA